jgi:hypothetical protein
VVADFDDECVDEEGRIDDVCVDEVF